MLVALPVLMARAAPSLSDYTRFHGMHIGPAAAQSCVQSFADGVILFAPSSSTADDFPLDGRSRYEVSNLTTIKYYLLVLATLTGLCTIVGRTDIVDARDKSADLALQQSHSLHPSAAMLSYVTRRVGTAVTAMRRFEYNFRLVGLSVVMCHYKTADDRLHLIEVYESRYRLLIPAVVAAFAAVLAWASRVILL